MRKEEVSPHLLSLSQTSSPHLKYVGEVPEIENVVELDGCREESGRHFLVQSECSVHQFLNVLLHLIGEPSCGDMALENTQIDGPQRVNLGGRPREKQGSYELF